MGWAITPSGVFTAVEQLVVGKEGRPSATDSPWSAFKALEARRDIRKAALGQTPLVRIWDHQHQLVGTVQPLSLRAEELAADTGTGALVIDGEHHVAKWLRTGRRPDSDVMVTIDPIPTLRSWRDRWGGKATVSFKQDPDGRRTAELSLVHHRQFLKSVLVANVPFAPPEAQIVRMRVQPGPTRSTIALGLLLDLGRQYGVYGALANPLNPGAWASALEILDASPLHWAVQPQFVNPLLDSSMWGVLASSFGDYHTATSDMLKTSGCQIRAYTWLPEDSDSPHPELEALIGPLARPSRPAVILATEDRSGVTGLIGTPLTGLVSLGAKMADDSVTELLAEVLPLDSDGDGKTDPVVASLLGVAPAKPAVVFREHSGGIGESSLTHQPATAHTVTTGGKSPQILNDLISFGVKYGLSRLQDLLQGGQFGGTWQVPGTPGLDELYQGQFADRVATHTRAVDALRRARSGDYAWLESFERGAGTGWTISAALSLRAGLWKGRPRIGKTVKLVNGRPWCVGRDFTLGDRVGFEASGAIFAEHVTMIGIELDQDTPVTRTIGIGETDDEDPFASVVKALQGVWGLVGAVAGGSGAF